MAWANKGVQQGGWQPRSCLMRLLLLMRRNNQKFRQCVSVVVALLVMVAHCCHPRSCQLSVLTGHVHAVILHISCCRISQTIQSGAGAGCNNTLPLLFRFRCWCTT
jgi:hypothetical protein